MKRECYFCKKITNNMICCYCSTKTIKVCKYNDMISIDLKDDKNKYYIVKYFDKPYLKITKFVGRGTYLYMKSIYDPDNLITSGNILSKINESIRTCYYCQVKLRKSNSKYLIDFYSVS